MKKIKILFTITALFSVTFLYFTACSDKSELTAPKNVDLNSPEFAIVDYTDAQNGIEDATLDTDMTFNQTLLNYNFMSMGGNFAMGNPMMRGNGWMERFDFGKHLGLFFRGLNLSDAQKGQLKDIMKNFHDNMKPLVKSFYDANKDIISAANAARKAIVDKVKNGTMTRADAAVELKKLNQDTRDKIDANPASIDIKKKMCDARTKLLGDIRAILTGDQVTKWDNAIKLIKNPC